MALAAKWLTDTQDPFFVLNSDVICAFPFEQLKEAHAKNKGEATIAVSLLSFSFYSSTMAWLFDISCILLRHGNLVLPGMTDTLLVKVHSVVLHHSFIIL